VHPSLATVLARLASPRGALVVGSATLLLAAAAVPLAFVSGGQSSGLPAVPFGLVGYVVASRQRRNPIGWILLALAFVFLLASDAGQYAVMAYRQGYHLPLARAAAFVAGWWIWLALLLPLPVGLFPDGRLSGRWRYVLWAYAAVGGALVAVLTWRDATGIGARRIEIDSTGELKAVGSASGAAAVLYALFLAFCAFWVLRPVLAYRHSTGDYRQQLKWLLSGGVICLVGFVLTLSGLSFAFAAILALPIGMGVGILKHRLYEVDRLISRTVSYLIVTGLLAGAFVGIVVLTTRVLPFSSSVGVAASTLAAAGLFNPLRLRVQRVVDRRFNRARYDAEAIVAAFSAHLRGALDVETVRSELLGAVGRAVEPAHATLWIGAPAPTGEPTPALAANDPRHMLHRSSGERRQPCRV
jgi:hypothetical protein